MIRSKGVLEPPDFVQSDIPDDASVNFMEQIMSIISLRSDSSPAQVVEPSRVALSLRTWTDPFVEKGSAASEFTPLFVPTERTAYEYHTVTKNYLILNTVP